MRISQFLLETLKETPADAELISHKLMLRAGLMQKLATGLYTWLPLGFRVLHKITAIVREEMNRAGAQEILMPTIQPAELWHETGRWEQFGPELLKFTDRHKREFCYGPTHEEIITDLARKMFKSYKQLPMNLYQIQTKFRDEIRPRFGVMRAREFLMKDAYSFHLNEKSLADTYQIMYDAYWRIFSRVGLKFRAVLADTGSMGGNTSHEFQALADSGESVIAYNDQSDYAANVEMAEAIAPPKNDQEPLNPLTLVDTPNQKTIEDICQFLKMPAQKTVKTLLVRGKETPLIALILRGDHQLNEIKVAKLLQIAQPLTFVNEETAITELGCNFGSIGPVNLEIPLIVDRSAAVLVNFTCGANQNDKHYNNVNWIRDVTTDFEIADIRDVMAGDLSPDGKGTLKIARGIEVGQVFQLGKKYTESMQATVLDNTGKAVPMLMGCYGVGISRTIAAIIEQYHDDKGIIWPESVAPFHIALVPIAMQKSERLKIAAEALYHKLIASGYDVLFDDRNERAGVIFADMDLIGIPHRLVISERGLDQGTIEYKARTSTESTHIRNNELMDFLRNLNLS